jgi:hypothetical protein
VRRHAGGTGAADTRAAHRRSTTVTVLAFFVVLATLFFSPAWFTPDAWIGGKGDEVLESWYMGWMPWAVAHGHNPLISTYLGYPSGLNAMWNTSVPLLSFVGTPVLWLFGSRVEYHMWLTLGVSLSAFFAYLFARRRVRLVPAVLAGLMYGFSPFVLAQSMAHLHETFVVAPPLFLMLFDDLLVRRTRSARRSGAYMGGLAAAQLLIAEEVLATVLVVTTIGLILLALLNRERIRDGLQRLLVAAGVALPVAIVLTAYPLYVQFAGPQRLSGPIQPLNYYVTDVLNLFVPNTEYFTPTRAVQIAAHWSGNSIEQTAYLSVPGLILISGVVASLWYRRIVLLFAAMFAAVLMLSFGPHLHVGGMFSAIPLPWAVIDHLPILQSMLPARLSLYLFLFSGLIVAHGLDATMNLSKGFVVSAGAWALTAATVAALLPMLPAASKVHAVPSFFQSDNVALIPDGSVALVAPWSDGREQRVAATNTLPMLWQVAAGFRYRMPSGYVLPTITSKLGATMVAIWLHGSAPDENDPHLRSAMLDEVHAWKLAAILVGPMSHRADMIAFFTALLSRPGRAIGGVTIWTRPLG